MEVLESGEQSALQWDRKLSELSEPGDPEALTYPTEPRSIGESSAGRLHITVAGSLQF
ncbi:Cyclic AMP-responsive element-binding protein 3-like protein 2 [Myotis davidii]|uniref:Cyclic AMP-responsive element-binding protein 3-like protein 2 n=1 Tax=Myotis davidii TaxID=225400 RepID=L5M514_MYODS|nr:Cyclic AMP-responsive element-binding protein 3-like protein 2 [Myotis davidii]